MLKIVEEFLDIPKNKRLVTYSGAIAGLAGVFLSIPVPEIIDVKKALINLQLFWLVLLTLALTSLFISFVKFIWKKEKVMLQGYDVPIKGGFTAISGSILFTAILNLWRYMLGLYAEVFAAFTIWIGFPAVVIIGSTFLAIFLQKREEKMRMIWSFIAISIMEGVLSAVAGVYIHEGITGYFYPFWFTIVAPSVAGGFFLLFLIGCLYNKVNPLKPYNLVT